MDPLRPATRSPRIRVLPGGHLLIGATIVLGILAAHTGHNVLAALVALLLAFQAVSGFRSFGVLRGTRLTVRLPHAVDAGGVATAEVEVSRPGRRGAARSLEVEAIVEGDRVEVPGAYVVRLAPGATARLRIPVIGRARGVGRITGWRVSSAYPCDLFRRTFRFAAPSEVLVRPAVRAATPPAAERTPDAAGTRRVVARGGGETRGLRPFRDGDPIRAISWRATARTGRLVVREQDETSRDRWAVVLDPEAGAPGLEDDVSAAAALLRHATDERRTADLCLAGVAAPIGVATRRGLDVALDALARFVPGGAAAPSPGPLRRAFLVGGRARAPEAVESLRAPFRWVAPAPPPEPVRRDDAAEVDAARPPLRVALAAWSFLVAILLGVAVASPLAVLPQALAAAAALALGARAERFTFGPTGRLGVLAACAGFAFLPGAPGGALLLVRFLSALVASLHVRRRTTGEDGFVLATLLTETALAAAFTSSALAAVAAVVLVVLAHRAVGHWHALRARERSARRQALVVGADDPVAGRRAADRAAAAVLVLAVPLFAALPRTDTPFLSIPNVTPGVEPGVPATLRLGVLARVTDGRERVATLKPINDAAANEEPYLRAAAWETFDGVEWTSASNGGRATPSYQREDGRLPIPSMVNDPSAPRWTLVVDAGAGRRLPLPPRAAVLAFGDPLPQTVELDDAGAITPSRDAPVARWRLDVGTGTPTSAASHREPDASHLAVPATALATRLAPEVARALAGVEGVRARAQALEAWVASRARYALDARLDRRDPLGDFLFGTRAGHCEYFASALAVALRLAGIPSRVVGGFHASLWNETGRFWVVRRRDAHAWVEAWAEGDGWFRLDATPPAGRPTEGYEGALGALARVRDALAFAWDQQVLGYDADRQRALVAALRGGFAAGFERLARHPLEATLLVGAGALAAAARWIRRRRSVGTRGPSADGPPGAGGSAVWFYDEMLDLLADRGWPRRPSETPRAFAHRLAGRVPPAVGEAVAQVTSAHERTRFGAAPLAAPTDVADWLAAVRAAPKRPRREVDTRPVVP
ncbi:MAG: transglutaminaseTgpA domain-containing protein [Planctomycetota bacterium]